MGRTRKQTVPGGADGRAGDGDDADLLFYLRTKYTLLGKAEWWWLMDESLAEISRRLETEHFVVIDGFLSRDAVSDLRDEIRSADDAGHLAPASSPAAKPATPRSTPCATSVATALGGSAAPRRTWAFAGRVFPRR